MINTSIRAFFNALDTHPMITLFATVGATTTVGAVLYNVLDAVQQTTPNNSNGIRHGTDDTADSDYDSGERRGHPTTAPSTSTIPVLTLEQARLRAMIESAQKSTWRQNIDNAIVAQERFMLPGRTNGGEVPYFMKKIEARAVELIQQNELQRERELERERKRKITSKMW